MDREAWRAAVHGVSKSRTRLSHRTELNCGKVLCDTCTMIFTVSILTSNPERGRKGFYYQLHAQVSLKRGEVCALGGWEVPPKARQKSAVSLASLLGFSAGPLLAPEAGTFAGSLARATGARGKSTFCQTISGLHSGRDAADSGACVPRRRGTGRKPGASERGREASVWAGGTGTLLSFFPETRALMAWGILSWLLMVCVCACACARVSHSVCVFVCVLVAQSCPTLFDSVDYNLPGSFVHGILQARILEWVAMASSRGSSQPRDRIWVSCIAGRFFTV